MNEERDEFLTEAIGDCWHRWCGKTRQAHEGIIFLCLCGASTLGDNPYTQINNFSTWPGFGKLWEWAQKQEWLEQFLNEQDVGTYIPMKGTFSCDIQMEFIHPDRFTDALYEFLKEKNL